MCLASLILYLTGGSAGLAALFPLLRRWRRRSDGAAEAPEIETTSISGPIGTRRTEI